MEAILANDLKNFVLSLEHHVITLGRQLNDLSVRTTGSVFHTDVVAVKETHGKMVMAFHNLPESSTFPDLSSEPQSFDSPQAPVPAPAPPGETGGPIAE